MVVDGFAVYVDVPQADGTPGAEERADWLRWLLGPPSLPAGISRFARDTLAEATPVLWARQALGGADYHGLSDDDLASELKDGAFLLGRLRRDSDARGPSGPLGMRETTRTTSSTMSGSTRRRSCRAFAGLWGGFGDRPVLSAGSPGGDGATRSPRPTRCWEPWAA